MSQLGNNEKINEGANEAPQLCRTCFEFFGNKHNGGLCSKCFKDQCKAEEKIDTVLTHTAPVSYTAETTETSMEEKTEETIVIEKVEEKVEEPKPVVKEENRCFTCSKKVNLLGFKCKCGSTFCKSHRLPEDHDCEFDFKELARAKLAKENPNITAPKIQKI